MCRGKEGPWVCFGRSAHVAVVLPLSPVERGTVPPTARVQQRRVCGEPTETMWRPSASLS